MPRKNQNGDRSANGMGNVRQKTVTRKGKQYTYWEARCIVGRDAVGKQIQKSISGQTKATVTEKLSQEVR